MTGFTVPAETGAAAHTERVGRSFTGAEDPRLARILDAAVRHLHAFAEEVGLTREEWRSGIDFLTAVGQKCTPERQELILLSDTLGLSMLLEILDGSPAGTTEPTVLGPFHVPGSPQRSFGDSIVDDPATGGDPLVLTGAVRDPGGDPIAGAEIDVWQVQPHGRYDIEEDSRKRNLRGVFTSRSDGTFRVVTVRPVDYTIADDGPVGEMLRAAGRGSWRPAHIHLAVSAPGFRTLVTHVFDRASPQLHEDAVFGVRPSLVTSMEGGECHFDVVLARS
ncbi:MAG: dioxygenase [Acidimicrobiales bacterium]